jgi:hypothetical protein
MSEKMTYQERVQKAAQMHADKWNSKISYEEEYEASFTDADCIEDGKVTVAAQAQAIRDACSDPTICHTNGTPMERYLLEHGYVEPKAEEDDRYNRLSKPER